MHNVHDRLYQEVIAGPEDTKQAALAALDSIKDVMETRTKIRLAQLDISGLTDLDEARRILMEKHAAIFTSDVDFVLHGMKGRLQGPRGNVGPSKKSKAAKKRERQARRNGRR